MPTALPVGAAKGKRDSTGKPLNTVSIVAESEGFEPSDPVTQIGSLANYWFQPLTHDSE